MITCASLYIVVLIMEKEVNYVRLVQQAQLGDEESLTCLAEAVSRRLYSYVYRYTLADDLTQDIVQETILTMLEVLGELKEADRFWPWLFKIALSKVFGHRRADRQRKSASRSMASAPGAQNDKKTAIADMVGKELREVIFAAMRELKPRQRAIINMRCYDEMSYSEIAEIMMCSKFAAQMLFYRAKKSLKKSLARNGFGKGSLLMGLILFGKMTAPSKAAAAQFTLTAATTKVGVTASAAAIAASKTAVLSMTTAGVLTVGTMVATSGTDNAMVVREQRPTGTPYVMTQGALISRENVECWYYYPPNGNGAVITQFKSDTKGERSYYQWLQNEQANYYKRKNAVYIRNSRDWAKDLSVRRLPTDSPELTDFLSRVEGKKIPLEYVHYNGDGMLVIAKQEKSEGFSQITHRYDVSGEEYFRYNWQGEAKVVDKRDAMHKRGWTYFTVAGDINGQAVTGSGRIPFIYSASQTHWPWLKLQVGQSAVSEAGFAGLCRPWMGLHTIDTVRRDAGERGILFETKIAGHKDGLQAEVMLTYDQIRLLYTIDMEADVIDRITFLSKAYEIVGRLKFSYLQEIDSAGNEFVEPREKSYTMPQDIPWLVQLAESTME